MLRSAACWLVAALLVAAYAAMVGRYAVNFPSADDFGTILRVPVEWARALTLREKLTKLTELVEAHRFVTLRLATLIEAKVLGSIDFRILLYAGSSLLLLAGVLLLSTVDREARPLFAGIAAALLLSPANYEATLWTTGALEHFGLVAYAFAALYCLSRPGLGWQIGAAVLALAAAGTSASGLMLAPAGVLMLCLMRRWPAALAWMLCGTALFAVYFIGYHAPPYQGSLATYLRDPLAPTRFFLMVVGGLGIYASVALGLGVMLVAYWIWMVASGRIKSLSPVVIAWAAFLWLAFAAIAWGRASFGDRGALLSRYRVYSELLVLLSIVALFRQAPRARGMRLMWGVLPLSVLWFLFSWRHELPGLEGFVLANRTHLDFYVAEGSSVPDYPIPVGFRDLQLEEARQFGVYDPSWAASAPRDLVSENRTLDGKPSASVWVATTPSVGRHAMIVIAFGPGHEADGTVWVGNGERSYRGKLDAVAPAMLAFGHRTGLLWGVYALAGVTPGRYRLGVGVDGNAPAVAWSDYWINVE